MKIFVKVKPGARESKIQDLGGSNFLVQVKALAKDGEANLELEKVLAEHFKVPKGNIFIKTGRTGRFKIVEVRP